MGCRVKGMSTQEYRRSYDYRRHYFEKNPGVFGCVWFCSQCYKPLFGKKNVYVDHIVPLNKGGLNHVSNCTAICFDCNSAKSDIVDGRVIKGKIFKLFESNASRMTRGAGAVVGIGMGLTAGAASLVTRKGVKAAGVASRFGIKSVFKLVGMALGIVSFPLRKGSISSRFCFLAIYALAIMYFLSENTTILNAWL